MASAFTKVYNGLFRQLRSTVGIAPHVSQDNHLIDSEWEALWDTGATNTLISQRIVTELGLAPVSYCKVSTPQGTYDAARYYIDLYLPNHVKIPRLLAIEGVLSGFDVLVGMDIIGKGDFAVTNFNGRTMFSFRFPSMMDIDFEKNHI